MKSPYSTHLSSFTADQRGQVLPWMAFLIALFIGAAGLTIDLGHAYACYRELQASTDAAALAAGYELTQPTATSASVQAAATKYSSVSGNINANANLPNPTINTTLNCSTMVTNNLGLPCSGSSTGDNVVRVSQNTVIPTYFMKAFAIFGVKGAKSISLTAVSTAAGRGAVNSQYNVAVVIDTTGSMQSQDNDKACGDTRINCALSGVRTLLTSLSPCTPSGLGTDCKGGKAFDTASLFTYPNVEADTSQYDTDCSKKSTSPSIKDYYTPVRGATWSAPTGKSATYQITDYLSDYSSSGKSNGSLNTSSLLAIAAGGNNKSGCQGLQAPGGKGTYYAGAIYAAQSSLIAAQAANPGSQNALIILSDGDAQSGNISVSGTVQKAGTGKPALTVDYPATNNQCQQAIDAAKFASSQGTTVYTVAYGASSSSGKSGSCSTDTPAISACSALKQMATSSSNFYSDATASQSKGECTSTDNPNLSLDQIFKSVANTFTVSRLVPNSYYN